MRAPLRAAAIAGLLAGGTAIAADTYKCESGGRVTYTDRPCPEARQSTLDLATPPIDPREAAAARERTAADTKRADAALAAMRKRSDEDAARRAKLALAERQAAAAQARRDAAALERASKARSTAPTFRVKTDDNGATVARGR